MSDINFSYYQNNSDEKSRNITISIDNCDKMSSYDIIEEFEVFLKACGYTFDGYIDIVPFDDSAGCLVSSDEDCNDIEWDNRPNAKRGNFMFSNEIEKMIRDDEC